ncbi:MAG TPA: carboxypeptidase-like regulatory domain-containing protein [Bryobacteraceae bacterium]
MRKSVYLVALVLSFWPTFAYPARPKDQEATHVVITVLDPTGAVVPGAEVWIGRASDSLKPFFIANDQGTLTANVQPGRYEINAQFPAFRAQRQQLTVLKAEEQRVNIRLQIGSCSSCVVVRSAPVPEPAVPLPSPSIEEVPANCRRVSNMPDIGWPVFSKAEIGMYYGFSFLQNHLVSPSPVPLYIWIGNTRDQDINVSSGCDLVRNAGIRVRSIQGRRVSRRETSPRSQLCSARVPVRIPAHSCFAFAKLDLNDIYELHSGVYSVAAGKKPRQKQNSAEQKGLLLFQYQALVPTR